ncbi:MAG TPA: EAL domain-containing protein [Acidimicrobiales bacterium]|nr:EAL domain-containing protein [Acidimicrobiales bacterium]
MTQVGASILIVDDEPQNRRLLEAILAPEGYRTVSAASGAHALELIAAKPPDLILLDVMMPGMDGYQVARVLKADAASSSIPIIMVTAQIDASARLAGLDAGAEEFLTKPVDRAELWLRVRNLLRLKAYSNLLQDNSAILEQQILDRAADLQRFRVAMDATAEAIVMVDRATGTLLEVNATTCTMLGYSRDELFQLGPAGIWPENGPRLEAVYDQLIAGGGTDELTHVLLRKDRSALPVEIHRHAQQFGDSWVIVAVLRDITERKESQRLLQRQAHYDHLTGLPNRVLFYDALGKALVAARNRGWIVAVLFVDLDNFKNVNDTHGHGLGDELLLRVGQRLLDCVRLRDTVGRLSGDEFAVMLLMEGGHRGAASCAIKVLDALRTPFLIGDVKVTVTGSIGITVCPDDATDPGTMIKNADAAMYQAKDEGRDTFRFFTPEMNTQILEQIDLREALREACVREEFVLHYQPKMALRSGQIVGVEALLRWQRPGRGLVSPAGFIEMLEQTGLIVDVGRWVIATACEQIARWRASPLASVQISVNVAARQLSDGGLEDDVIGAIREHEIPSQLLELELTESASMANTELSIGTLQRLRSLGVKISIDDFGTGYSSLAYLRHLPIDKLKIDIAFIREITTNAHDAAIARAIIDMAHTLQLEVIAEGVETGEQLTYLREHGCDQMQGYHLSAPLPLSELEDLLHQHVAAT